MEVLAKWEGKRRLLRPNRPLAWSLIGTSHCCCFLFSVDNSDYMRNGDFVPTRLQAQQDAVNLVCHSKTRSNPENNVGLIVMSR